MNTMKILFILHEKNLGGGTKSALDLMQKLRERGHDVEAVVPYRTGKASDALREHHFVTHYVFFGWWMMPSYWNPLMKWSFRALYSTENIAAGKIAQIIQNGRFDIVHSNSSVIDVGAKAALISGIPHIWHFREYGDLDYRLEFLLGKERSCHFVSDSGSKVIYISKSLEQHYQNLIGVHNGLQIYNGFPDKFSRPKQPFDYNKKKVVFLISGNLQRNKGQYLAIRACTILHERGCDNYQLLIAGAAANTGDSKKYERELHRMSAKLNGHVKFTGFVDDIAELRRKADVELVCSDAEAFGRVTVEAMLSSNMVIGSNSGATPELIEDGVNGYLYRRGDASALAAQMEKCIKNPELTARMGMQAYRKVLGKYTIRKTVEEVERLYTEMVSEKMMSIE